MNDIENIRFFLGDLKASNYNQSFIQDVENLIKENTELRIQISARETVVDELEKENKELKEKTNKAINMLEKHIQYCEQEAKGSLNNEVCNIALRFDKHLLQVLKGE